MSFAAGSRWCKRSFRLLFTRFHHAPEKAVPQRVGDLSVRLEADKVLKLVGVSQQVIEVRLNVMVGGGIFPTVSVGSSVNRGNGAS